MEIHPFYYSILWVILFFDLEAKPFSLNKAIAENSDGKLFETLTNISPENSEETFPLKGALRPSSATQRLKEIGDILTKNIKKVNKKKSPLKYKKKIYSKNPKSIELPTKPRYKRKHLSKQREVYDDEGINKRYLPLLRSISMLFDDILSTDSESRGIEDFASSNPRRDFECPCSSQGDLKTAQSRPREKTTVTTEASYPKIQKQIETTTSKADITTSVHFSTFGQDKIIPPLFPRNTPSIRRNYNGIGKGNGSPRQRHHKNSITRNSRVSKYDSRERGDETYTQDNEENSARDPRNNANGRGLRGGRLSGGNRDHTTTTEVTVTEQTEAETKVTTQNIIRGYVNDFKRQDSIETGRDTTESTVQAPRNQTESPIYAAGSSRRLRGHTAKIKIPNHSESLQPEEFYEKGVLNVTLGFPRGKRRPVGAGFIAEKDQKNRAENKRIEPLLPDPDQNTENSMVMIIDGYSVARDKNGQNLFSKKQYKHRNT